MFFIFTLMKKLFILILLCLSSCSHHNETGIKCITTLTLEKTSISINENIIVKYTTISKNIPNEIISIQITNSNDSLFTSTEFSINLKDGTNTGNLLINTNKLNPGEYQMKWGTMHTNGKDLYFKILQEEN